MKRVVITGMGVISCLGNNLEEVTVSLREGRSGIRHNESYAELGMRSRISGTPVVDLKEQIDRKQYRFMGDAAAYAFLSMQQAISDAGLDEGDVSNVRTGIIAGSGGASSSSQVAAADILRERGLKRSVWWIAKNWNRRCW